MGIELSTALLLLMLCSHHFSLLFNQHRDRKNQLHSDYHEQQPCVAYQNLWLLVNASWIELCPLYHMGSVHINKTLMHITSHLLCWASGGGGVTNRLPMSITWASYIAVSVVTGCWTLLNQFNAYTIPRGRNAVSSPPEAPYTLVFFYQIQHEIHELIAAATCCEKVVSFVGILQSLHDLSIFL